jgi:hypothetical protein
MEQSVRMNIIKERLRRKAEANAAAKNLARASGVQPPINTCSPALTDGQLVEEFGSILVDNGKKGGNNKKHTKK